MAVGFGGTIFQGAGDVGVQIGRAVEETLGALGDEGWWGRGGVGEDAGRGERGLPRHGGGWVLLYLRELSFLFCFVLFQSF